MTSLEKARWLSLLVPAGLLAGALGSQKLRRLKPCEMFQWPRWPHNTADALALISFAMRGAADRGRSFVWLAALAILTSGLIGVYHAGVEAGVFEGLTQCSSMASGRTGADLLKDIMATPLVRCDQVQWSFLGISMAGWNAIISIGSALVILWLSLRRPRMTIDSAATA